jgi:hypothetical protein
MIAMMDKEWKDDTCHMHRSLAHAVHEAFPEEQNSDLGVLRIINEWRKENNI